VPKRAWIPPECGSQVNGWPQKKQNRLSAFTMVPQLGQRFLVCDKGGSGVAAAGADGGGCAGYDGFVVQAAWDAVGAEGGGCDGRAACG
jgi:hypothetical protein